MAMSKPSLEYHSIFWQCSWEWLAFASSRRKGDQRSFRKKAGNEKGMLFQVEAQLLSVRWGFRVLRVDNNYCGSLSPEFWKETGESGWLIPLEADWFSSLKVNKGKTVGASTLKSSDPKRLERRTRQKRLTPDVVLEPRKRLLSSLKRTFPPSFLVDTNPFQPPRGKCFIIHCWRTPSSFLTVVKVICTFPHQEVSPTSCHYVPVTTVFLAVLPN